MCPLPCTSAFVIALCKKYLSYNRPGRRSSRAETFNRTLPLSILTYYESRTGKCSRDPTASLTPFHDVYKCCCQIINIRKESFLPARAWRCRVSTSMSFSGCSPNSLKYTSAPYFNLDLADSKPIANPNLASIPSFCMQNVSSGQPHARNSFKSRTRGIRYSRSNLVCLPSYTNFDY